MKKLDIKEMKSIEGGASGVLIGSIIGVIITFVIGIFDGYANPEKCNN